MSKNSHIQIPNFILKQFRSPNGQVLHLDLDNNRIRSCSSKKLGTEYGYYSDEIEDYLNKEIENPFSDYVAQIIRFVKDGIEKTHLPIKIEDVCKKYVTSAIYRSRYVMDYNFKNSFIAFMLNEQTIHDQMVFFGTQENNGILPPLQSHKMTVIINKSTREFVAPRNCWYCISSEGAQCVILPISPHCALELAPEGSSCICHNGGIDRLFHVDDPDDVAYMNNNALQFEYAFNHSFIASSSKEELFRLQEYCNANRDFLETERKRLEE
jgi:hypothetical protein